ncbi:ABC transporter ATP-binding protein [Plantactinospora soyae]|uniref:ABC-2 type transport system ATP-binding protein n=1 Tax=Plantactinospora soyae TaxID=1544732 RepID=A0A927MAL2_9ACTN|nr:ABC transporter ATP-binding protein [Plantactinospora soyae]MBE1489656.1 ABC-2 type transport system ATP-binding protein [Plantactinospora soyae]
MTEPRIQARGLVREFGAEAGVRGIDLDVEAGEIHALVGLNGAGKSTLMRLLLGMLRPDSGTVHLDGHGLDSAPWSRVGHLIENPLAYGELTGHANLVLAARLHGVPAPATATMVERVLSELNLHGYAAIRAGRMSLGNRQRLGLAAALQHDPDVIVLDEPTNALDPAGVILLREALLRRAASGAGVLVSSHHLDEVARVADRITVINAGHTIGALDPSGTDIEREFFALVHADDERTAA